MFNYLQEKRPKRRKSANLLNVFSSQTDSESHADPRASTPGSGPEQGAPLGSPTIGTQNASSLTRLASRQRKHIDGPLAEKQTHWSFKGDRPHTSASHGPPSMPFNGAYNGYPSLSQPRGSQMMQEAEPWGPDRPKRLIDVRFEQMRAAPGPTFQHLAFDAGLQANVMPLHMSRPPPPPPPPPKSAPNRAYLEDVQDDHTILDESAPTLSRPIGMRNKQPLSGPQRQPSTYLQAEMDTHEKTPSQARFSRPRLNLMNPMQLLARRRSHKPQEITLAEDQTAPAPQLPADYDPRIRGKVVHDFSAPRPLKQDMDNIRSGQRESVRLVGRDDSPHSQEHDHAPVFKEEFEDGLEKSQDPATRSQAFLHTAAIQASQNLTPDPNQLPSFAPKVPLRIATDSRMLEKVDSQRSDTVPPVLEIVVESPDKDLSKPLPFPPRAASSSTSVSDKTVSGLGSPQRHKSTSSRFSFDLGGVGSTAQEKLLEDKHREKVQQKQRQSVLSYQSTNDDEQYDDFDDMDDGGFEERIPGVNCDEDDDPENNLPALQRDAEAFPYGSPNKSSFDSTDSPVSTGVTSLDTPFFGVPWASSAASKSVPNVACLSAGDVPSTETLQNIRPQSSPKASPELGDHKSPHNNGDLDDDIYFDDGLIDEIGDVNYDDGFDENVFDDNSNGLYGLPLRDRTIKPSDDHEAQIEESISQSVAPQNSVINKADNSRSSINRSLSSGAVSAELRDALTDLGHPNVSQFSQTAGLTHDNLAAYDQNNLVNAVNQAAQNGTFDRTHSLQSQEPPQLPALDTSHPEQVNTHPAHLPTLRGGFEDANDDDDNFDELDDIVAAANAEALENDDEGFYGTEFGFYARGGSTDSEFINGGYFGGKGANEGIMRSHSGKATNFQEPSLTPITERSEWSNRNSTISLAQLHHAHGFPTIPSPGFELGHEDLNTQLAMLKQLRRGAWGGSNASLPSSAGSQAQNHSQGISFASPLQNNSNNTASNPNLQNLSSSLPSSTSNESEGDSPTIILPLQYPSNTFSPPSAAPSMPPPPRPSSNHKSNRNKNPKNVRPGTGGSSAAAKGKGHERRDSAGAESISYKTEGGKWVMEKRRMSETGETLMVGRRVLDAGMI